MAHYDWMKHARVGDEVEWRRHFSSPGPDLVGVISSVKKFPVIEVTFDGLTTKVNASHFSAGRKCDYSLVGKPIMVPGQVEQGKELNLIEELEANLLDLLDEGDLNDHNELPAWWLHRARVLSDQLHEYEANGGDIPTYIDELWDELTAHIENNEG